MPSTNAFKICRPGRHTDAHGTRLPITETDLVECAEAYSPELHEAPLVVGHPKMEAPAYGWVESLLVEDGQLLAVPRKVNVDFAEAVNSGAYPKVSASFYLKDAPNNPKPGVLYLRHVGFLGAAAPAIKGLGTVSFSEAEEGVLTVEFGEVSGWSVAAVFRRLRDWLIAEKGLEEADKVLPDYLVKDVELQAAQPEPGETAPVVAYAEPPEKEGTVTTPTEQELAERQATLDQRERELAAREKKARRDGHVEFVEGLVKQGKVLPTQQEGLVAFLDTLPEGTVVEFGEGDAKTSQAPADWFKAYLTAQPKVVEFAELAGTGADDVQVVEFAAPSGYTADRERLELHQKALAYQSAHNCDYAAAVKAVGGH